MRTVGNYSAFIALIMDMMYFRAATVASIGSMSPVVVIFFGVVLLKDKFHSRYIIGLVICFIGTIMIISNESSNSPSSSDSLSEKDDSNATNMILGSFFGLIHVISIGVMVIGAKILTLDKMHLHVQVYFVGITNTICAIIQCILTGTFSFTIPFFLFSLTNGTLFYLASYFLVESCKFVEVSKTSALPYLGTLTVFFLGVVILGEPLFFTDIVGSALILSYNIYSAKYPVS